MTITIQDFAQALFLALQEAPDSDHDRIINNLVKELEMSGRLQDFKLIVAEFEKLLEMDGGVRQAEITLSKVAAVNEQLIDELNQQVGGNARFIEDNSIIGGAVIKVGDTQIDGSVKGKLENIKLNLSNSI